MTMTILPISEPRGRDVRLPIVVRLIENSSTILIFCVRLKPMQNMNANRCNDKRQLISVCGFRDV